VLLDPDAARTSYSYDVQNRLIEIWNPQNERTTLSWDALDREQKKTLANGMAVSHTYDATGRETLLENRAAAGTALAVFTATYDAVGNPQAWQELDGVRVTYGYDEIYQLINEQRSGANAYNTTYGYDGAGNRTLKNDSGQLTTYALNAASELVLVTPPAGQPTTISWDANGNMAEENAGGSRTTYAWDDENRMTRVALPDGTVETHAYSADGHRQRKDVGATVQRYVWDDENVLLELDGSLVTQVRYTDFPGFWGGLASQRRSGVSNFYGFDLQANSRILVSVGGAITDNYTFKAFGEELAITGTTANSLRFGGAVGYYRDTEARLYVRARQLSVVQGRWLSRDPIGFDAEDGNAYRYVGNNPVGAVDPTGLQEEWTGPCEKWEEEACERWCNEQRPPLRYKGCHVRYKRTPQGILRVVFCDWANWCRDICKPPECVPMNDPRVAGWRWPSPGSAAASCARAGETCHARRDGKLANPGMPCVGHGDHYKVICERRGRPNARPRHAGSVFCCPSCLDGPGGPQRIKVCGRKC
jgi:RHS repeat-associated protein